VVTSARGTGRRAGSRCSGVVEEAEQDAQLCVVGRLRPWKEGFMSMLNRSFARLLMMGSSPESVAWCVGDEGALQCWVLLGHWLFLCGVVSGMVREGTTV
jgi:hypothetical protein